MNDGTLFLLFFFAVVAVLKFAGWLFECAARWYVETETGWDK